VIRPFFAHAFQHRNAEGERAGLPWMTGCWVKSTACHHLVSGAKQAAENIERPALVQFLQ
jgi:hypothetical protein